MNDKEFFDNCFKILTKDCYTKLKPFQEEIFGSFLKEDEIFIQSKRQTGVSSLLAIFACYKLIFCEGKNILFININNKTNEDIKEKICIILNKSIRTFINNSEKIELYNGNKIVFISSNNIDKYRGCNFTDCIVDNALYLKNLDEIEEKIKYYVHLEYTKEINNNTILNFKDKEIENILNLCGTKTNYFENLNRNKIIIASTKK